jgi:hypothetical protein
MIIKGERAETGMHSAHAKIRGHGWLMAQASWQAGLAGHVTPQLPSGSSPRYTAKQDTVCYARQRLPER